MNHRRALAALALAAAVSAPAHAVDFAITGNGAWHPFSVAPELAPIASPLSWIDDSGKPLRFTFVVCAGLTGALPVVDLAIAGISSSSFYSCVKAGSAGTPLAAPVATPANFDGAMRANNPDFAYVDHDAQGYASATVTATATATATQLVVVSNKVKPLNADGTVPASPRLESTRFTVAAGSTTAVVEDNV